jgi:small subunit ribosomal protein S20
LAHSRSALKRWRQSIKNRDLNRAVKSRTRTLLRKALASLDEGAAAAEEDVRNAVAALDKAAQKGVIHANAAARGKSRLLKRFNLATAAAVVAAATSAAAEPEAPRGRRRAAASSEPAAEQPPARRTTRSRAAGSTDETKTPRGRTRKT